jgi:hypothetical protein
MADAPSSLALGPEEYEQEMEAHEGRVAASGEARGAMRQKTTAVAGAMGDEGDGGSVGGDGKRTIDESDDFTGMLMYVSVSNKAPPPLPALLLTPPHPLPTPRTPTDDAEGGG